VRGNVPRLEGPGGRVQIYAVPLQQRGYRPPRDSVSATRYHKSTVAAGHVDGSKAAPTDKQSMGEWSNLKSYLICPAIN
jgi:hypothetical protein